jgi:hypothetical protein
MAIADGLFILILSAVGYLFERRNAMQLYLPETIDLTRIDDKKAFFCDYIYTYSFSHKEQLAAKNNKNGMSGDMIDGYNLGDYNFKFSNYSCSNLNFYNSSYSNVVHSDPVPIYSQYMRSIISVHDYGRVKTELINDGIITCDWSYSNFDGNKKTMSYSLVEPHCYASPTIYEIQGKRFIDKLHSINQYWRNNLSPLEKALEAKLYEIEFDEKAAHQFLQTEEYETPAARIARENTINIMSTKNQLKYNLRRSQKVGRIFTPVTSSPKDMRQFFQYDEPLVEVDISCALPLLFNKYLLNENAPDVQLYRWLTSDEGEIDLYEYLGTEVWQEEFPIWNDEVRDHIKILTMVIFFGKQNTIRDLRRKFEQEFPTVSRVMKELKKKNYKILAEVLMKEESNLIIDEVSKEILEVEPYRLLLTIHDAMIVPESFSDDVKRRIIKAVERRINLTPKVKNKRIN